LGASSKSKEFKKLKFMKAAIYNPYLDTLGGGERYTMAVATFLREKGYQVDVEWKEENIKNKLEERFGINLENINFAPNIKRGDSYDLCFWVSDGSIPTLMARKNILHFQVPFHDVNGKTLLNKMKLFRINKIICNSFFTKEIIDSEYGVNSSVIYPPVDTVKIISKRKENLIIYIGRFSQLTQNKRQDVLIEAFRKLAKDYPDWKLVLAGASDIGRTEYVDELIKKTKDYKISILENPPFSEIKALLGQAKIFWSAAGYGVNEKKEPQKMEHFGITVVEAMAGGAVPLVFSGGGHKEIIEDKVSGFLWESPFSLLRLTKKLIEKPKELRAVSKNAKLRSKNFSYQRFYEEFSKII
jgi:glycosyltransferase involved in cell wall biosynthesis